MDPKTPLMDGKPAVARPRSATPPPSLTFHLSMDHESADRMADLARQYQITEGDVFEVALKVLEKVLYADRVLCCYQDKQTNEWTEQELVIHTRKDKKGTPHG